MAARSGLGSAPGRQGDVTLRASEEGHVRDPTHVRGSGSSTRRSWSFPCSRGLPWRRGRRGRWTESASYRSQAIPRAPPSRRKPERLPELPRRSGRRRWSRRRPSRGSRGIEAAGCPRRSRGSAHTPCFRTLALQERRESYEPSATAARAGGLGDMKDRLALVAGTQRSRAEAQDAVDEGLRRPPRTTWPTPLRRLHGLTGGASGSGSAGWRNKSGSPSGPACVRWSCSGAWPPAALRPVSMGWRAT
jgi:hypothetical protein